jgi:hypothetical protein
MTRLAGVALSVSAAALEDRIEIVVVGALLHRLGFGNGPMINPEPWFSQMLLRMLADGLSAPAHGGGSQLGCHEVFASDPPI